MNYQTPGHPLPRRIALTFERSTMLHPDPQDSAAPSRFVRVIGSPMPIEMRSLCSALLSIPPAAVSGCSVVAHGVLMIEYQRDGISYQARFIRAINAI